MKAGGKARQERLAAALRENLKRRKARTRALGETSAKAPRDAAHPAEEPSSLSPNPAAKKS
jgi:hypothetical protein